MTDRSPYLIAEAAAMAQAFDPVPIAVLLGGILTTTGLP